MTRRRPDDYVPFQSIFQPDGRHAYNRNAPQYPAFGLGFTGTPRDGSRMPSTAAFPRDTPVPMPINYNMMQHRGGYGGGYGGGYAGGNGGFR